MKVDRSERYLSYALVEVRKHRWLPFGIHSAVLLDVSTTGIKVELTSEVQVTPGERYWFKIPLTPLGIYTNKQLVFRAECRWFDEKRFRFGGVFLPLDDSQRTIIQEIIDALKFRS
jgi:hypothetical protein